MYRGTQTTDEPLILEHQGRERRYESIKARYQRRQHREYVERMEAREQKVLLAKIFRIGSASDILSEI